MKLVPSFTKKNHSWFDPFKELELIQRQMNQFFDLSSCNSFLLQESNAKSPLIDYDESQSHIFIKADLPGVDKKSIEVSVLDDVLTIKAERRQEKEVKKDGAHMSEKHYGHFARQIQLPSSIDANHIKAQYEDGVLKLELPKNEEVKSKQIKIDIK